MRVLRDEPNSHLQLDPMLSNLSMAIMQYVKIYRFPDCLLLLFAVLSGGKVDRKGIISNALQSIFLKFQFRKPYGPRSIAK